MSVRKTNENGLCLSKMNDQDQFDPNGHVNDFLIGYDIPAQFALDQLNNFRQHWKQNGTSAMFYEARFISWIKREIEK